MNNSSIIERSRASVVPEIAEIESRIQTPYGECILPRWLWEELLVDRSFRLMIPFRDSNNQRCCHCRERNLSHGSNYQLCRDCELDKGVNLGTWPYCARCECPFPTASAGNRGKGWWVWPAAGAAGLCESCALFRRFSEDSGTIVAALVTQADARWVAQIEHDRGRPAEQIVRSIADHLWCNAMLVELLRLARIPLALVARHIMLRARMIVIRMQADEMSIDAFAERDGWIGRAA